MDVCLLYPAYHYIHYVCWTWCSPWKETLSTAYPNNPSLHPSQDCLQAFKISAHQISNTLLGLRSKYGFCKNSDFYLRPGQIRFLPTSHSLCRPVETTLKHTGTPGSTNLSPGSLLILLSTIKLF